MGDASRLSVSEKLKENDEETEKTGRKERSKNAINKILLRQSGKGLHTIRNRT